MNNESKKTQIYDLNSDILYYNILRKEIINELESTIKNKKSIEKYIRRSDSETSFESNSSFDDKVMNDDVNSYFEFKKNNPKIITSLNITDNSNCFIDRNKDLICNINNFSSENDKLLFIQNNINELENYLDISSNIEDQLFF